MHEQWITRNEDMGSSGDGLIGEMNPESVSYVRLLEEAPQDGIATDTDCIVHERVM